MTDQHQDEGLLSRVSAGDRTAMKALYERHSDGVYQFVRSWLRDPHQAADIVHETMLSVWRNADKFQHRSTVKSWIFSIARNKAVDHNRKMGRASFTDEMPEIVDDAPDPLAYASANQAAAHLKECISQLSEAHRQVIHLTFFEELTYEQIAQIEDRPVGTIKTRVLHAKKLLARCVSNKENQRR